MFGQVRLPSDVSDEVDEDPSGSKAIWDRGLLSGASQKVRWYPVTVVLTITACIAHVTTG